MARVVDGQMGKDTPRPRADACHGRRCGGGERGGAADAGDGNVPAPERAEPADGHRGRTADKRNWRGNSGSYAAGVESRPEGIRRSTGGSYGARRVMRVRRGVRIAKDLVDSADRTVPGGGGCNNFAPSAMFPLEALRESSARSLLTLPGTGNRTPGFIDGETGKAEQRIQYWHAAGGDARVSGPGPRNREL